MLSARANHLYNHDSHTGRQAFNPQSTEENIKAQRGQWVKQGRDPNACALTPLPVSPAHICLFIFFVINHGEHWVKQKIKVSLLPRHQHRYQAQENPGNPRGLCCQPTEARPLGRRML